MPEPTSPLTRTTMFIIPVLAKLSFPENFNTHEEKLPAIYFIPAPRGVIIELRSNHFIVDGYPKVENDGDSLIVSFPAEETDSRAIRMELWSFMQYDTSGYVVYTPAFRSSSMFIFVPSRDEVPSEDKPTANHTDKQVVVVDETKATESEESARKTCEELYRKKEEIERMLADVDNRIHVARKRFLEFILS